MIGYWQSSADLDLPDPQQLVDPSWDPAERERVAEYFDSGVLAKGYMGRSSCRICGAANGSELHTDGRYAWPSGLSHYLRAHSVRLPHAIEEHALRRLDELDACRLSLDEWRRLTSR